MKLATKTKAALQKGVPWNPWNPLLIRHCNGAFMKFEKGNLFIKECLEDFPESYSSWLWAGSGPELLHPHLEALEW